MRCLNCRRPATRGLWCPTHVNDLPTPLEFKPPVTSKLPRIGPNPHKCYLCPPRTNQHDIWIDGVAYCVDHAPVRGRDLID